MITTTLTHSYLPCPQKSSHAERFACFARVEHCGNVLGDSGRSELTGDDGEMLVDLKVELECALSDHGSLNDLARNPLLGEWWSSPYCKMVFGDMNWMTYFIVAKNSSGLGRTCIRTWYVTTTSSCSIIMHITVVKIPIWLITLSSVLYSHISWSAPQR